VIDSLKAQTESKDNWECILIDNNSDTPVERAVILGENFKIVTEPKQGLTYARVKGVLESRHDLILMVDDDNILDNNYLENALKIFNTYKNLGAIGGKSFPLFEAPPKDFVSNYYSLLALRDLGDEIKIESYNNCYPEYAPIGAGMALRKVALSSYLKKIADGRSSLSDRKGKSLSSSGDNDIVLEILKSGWDVGYFPALKLQHIIPENRTTKEYLARINFDIQKSWVHFLLLHHLCPWNKISRGTLPLRKAKAWFTIKAWKSDQGYIDWKGICGRFEGLSTNA
jgi:glycosyltransferase involved in cell wall biosynthesis